MKRKQKLENKKGITLIALIITIIVMLILVGVTVSTVMNSGLFEHAREAADKTKASIANEQADIESLEEDIRNVVNGKITIKEAIERGEKFAKDGNKNVVDEFNNPVTIPAGFHIVMPKDDSTVEYDYSTENKGIPTVQDGIVVADEDENQFVWIPTGTIKDDKNGGTTTIKLGRYIYFNEGEEPKDEETVINKKYTEDKKDTNVGTGKSKYGNAIAKDIDEFKKKATSRETGGKGGYYLARFEAGVTNYDAENIRTEPDSSLSSDDKNNWTGYEQASAEGLKLVSKAGEQVWNYITQNKASEVAGKMYGADKPYTSDLVNSCAWDTAIVFIQKYSGNNNYANEKAKYTEGLKNTGSTVDKVCNIYDMASNCEEYTTETYNGDENHCCVRRGGDYLNNNNYTSIRNYVGPQNKGVSCSFRLILYVN